MQATTNSAVGLTSKMADSAHSAVSKAADAAVPIVDRLASTAHTTVDKAAKAATRIEERSEELLVASGRLLDQAQSFARDRPVAVLGFGLAVGLLLGTLLRRR